MLINEKTIAKSLTVLFHPILYPTYGFLLLFYAKLPFRVLLNPQAKQYILVLVLLNSFIVPLLLLLILKSRGLITSLKLENKNDRIYPLFIGLLFYAMSYFLISKLNILEVYSYVFFLASLLSIISIGINFFFKISLHSLGAAAFSAALLVINFVYGFDLKFAQILALVLTGIIASSRLILKAHKPSQVYSGLFVGFFVGLLSLLYFL